MRLLDTVSPSLLLNVENKYLTENCAGDSLAHAIASPPAQSMKAAQQWLQKVFRRKFVNNGDYLEHGIQQDSFSCGVVVSSTIKHAVFGHGIWIARRAVLERIEWFLRLAKGCKQEHRTSTITVSRLTFQGKRRDAD